MDYTYKIIESWSNKEGNINKTTDLLDWINKLNKDTYVNINECNINDVYSNKYGNGKRYYE